MTDREKYLRGCRYAVTGLIEKGSYAYTILAPEGSPDNDNMHWIDTPWKEIVEWLNKEIDNECRKD